MEILIIFIVLLIFFIIIYFNYKKSLILKRERFIDSFCFPESISQKIIEKHPHLSEHDVSEVLNGLREYFYICNIAGKRMVSMPSQVVDLAWHEFILFTKKYDQFCKKALGRFLHHTPAEAMECPTQAQAGIKTAWKIACHREGIRPTSPNKLPALFAIDAKLNISDGFMYSLDCTRPGSKDYCASHIGCSSGCGSGCASGCSGDSSGCGGGD